MTGATLASYPRITVVVPSFNQAPYLRATLESVTQQNYPNLELVVCDGGSTDGSLDILDSFRSWIDHLYIGPDAGQSDAIAKGVSCSSGELVGWLNSDDVLLSGALEAIAASHSAHPVDLYTGGLLVLDSEGSILRCRQSPRQSRWLTRQGIVVINQPGSFFRRAAYDLVGGINVALHYVMDWDLYIRMMSEGMECRQLSGYLAGFRLHSLSKTVGSQQRVLEEYEAQCAGPWRRWIHDGWVRRHRELLVRGLLAASGSYVRAGRDTFKMRGRKWSEVVYPDRLAGR